MHAMYGRHHTGLVSAIGWQARMGLGVGLNRSYGLSHVELSVSCGFTLAGPTTAQRRGQLCRRQSLDAGQTCPLGTASGEFVVGNHASVH